MRPYASGRPHVAVTGMRGPEMGQRLCAYVILRAGQSLTFHELCSFLLLVSSIGNGGATPRWSEGTRLLHHGAFSFRTFPAASSRSSFLPKTSSLVMR